MTRVAIVGVALAVSLSCFACGSAPREAPEPRSSPSPGDEATTAAPAETSCSPGRWRVETVAAEVAVTAPSLAVGPGGRVHAVWSRGITGRLMHATRGSEPGWTVNEIAAGHQSAVAVDSSGAPRVSFYDQSDRSLKIATPSSEGEWSVSTVESPDDGITDVGIASAVSVGPDGQVHVVHYVDRVNEPDLLRHGVQRDDGWSLETIDATMEDATRLPRPHLAIGSDGRLHVLYVGNRREGPRRLRPLLHATRMPGSDWRTASVADVSSRENGFEPSLAIDANGELHVTHHADGTFSGTTGFTELRHAHWTADGGWRSERWEWPPHVGGEVPLAVDPGGRIHVIYLAHGEERDRLDHAVGEAQSWTRVPIAEVSPRSPRLTIDDRGDVHVLFAHREGLEYAHLAACAP